jgi:hypothetical protein
MTIEQQNKAKELINNLGWDYDRMSTSGQHFYEKLYELFNQN